MKITEIGWWKIMYLLVFGICFVTALIAQLIGSIIKG